MDPAIHPTNPRRQSHDTKISNIKATFISSGSIKIFEYQVVVVAITQADEYLH